MYDVLITKGDNKSKTNEETFIKIKDKYKDY